MSNLVTPAIAAEANALWRNDTPALWNDIQAPVRRTTHTAWLMTFVDLTGLLICFFVLLFSLQSLEREQWQALNGGFKARFSTQSSVVEMVPDGASNAEVRVSVATSGLLYLDTLLRQRLQNDAVWGSIAVEQDSEELRYALSAEAIADDEAWNRLGGVVRGWKNPVGIRVIASKDNATAAAQKAVAIGGKLPNSGVMNAFADVKIDENAAALTVYFVVRAR